MDPTPFDFLHIFDISSRPQVIYINAINKNRKGSIMQNIDSQRFRGVFADPKNAEILRKMFNRQVGPALRVEGQLPQALAFWEAIRTLGKRFNSSLEEMQRVGNGELAKSLCAQDSLQRDAFHFVAEMLQEYREHESLYIRVISSLETLPTPVLRRWLWQENVDFQGYESFLRRLELEQITSLHRHADIVWQSIRENRSPLDYTELPCFAEDWSNRLANMFSQDKNCWNASHPHAPAEERYAPKSAIAFNFFGWDLGFKRHSDGNRESDEPNSGALILQVLLSRHGVDFSINTESRGVYWYLYRTLRANHFWGDPDAVELRSHVCPGFWATVFAWLFFLIGSPACLAAAAVSTNVPNLIRCALFALGAVTPSILAFLGMKALFERFGPRYKADYTKNVAGVLVCLFVVGNFGKGLYEVITWFDWKELINWVIAVFAIMWVAQMASQDKLMSPYKLPFFGPLFTYGIIGRAIWIWYDRYSKANWEMLVAFVKANRSGLEQLCSVVGFMLVGLLILWTLVACDKKVSNYIRSHAKSVEKKTLELLRTQCYAEAKAYAKRAEWIWGICTVVAVVGSLAMGKLSAYTMDQRLGNDTILLGIVLVAFSISISARLGWCFLSMYVNETEHQFLQGRLSVLSDWEYEALLRNPVFHPGYGVFRFDLYETLCGSSNYLRCKRAIGNSTWKKLLKQLTENGLKKLVNANVKTKPHLLRYIALGLSHSQARKAYKADQIQKAEAAKIQKHKLYKLSPFKTFGKILTVVGGWLMYIPRFFLRLYLEGKALKAAFDNACPHIDKPNRMM